ncbi:ParB N-terminal domain-containing protein [uncultured Polaribacter sp.]|uniref:ParB N-terminal domain-containing protein n=1 Tax=uncultured Polaribacter sp. TaxID=174711 RepID=UPI00259B833E|nr:ParB N-terminal domain-containing protein [uncultured Polaribacter sp.]
MKKLVNVKSIKETPGNPRFIKDAKFKKLVKSIKTFPEMLEIRPIVVDETMTILGGNMRLRACKSAGIFEVWIYQVFNLTEQQKREFIIKDNSGFGEWDWDILANEWDVQQLSEWGVDLPVFDLPIEDDEDKEDQSDKEVCEMCGK